MGADMPDTGLRSVEIRRLREDEVPDIEAFYYSHLPTAHRLLEIQRWRSGTGLITDANRIYVAICDGRIVGTLNAVEAWLRSGDRSFRAVWHHDVYVLSESRGLGVAAKLAQEAAEGADVVLSKGTSRPMYKLRKKMGFTDLQNTHYQVLIEKPFGGQVSPKRRLAQVALWALALPGRWLRPKPPGSTYKVRRHDGPETLLNPVGSTTQHAVEILPIKDLAYLKSRYMDMPGKRYMIYSAHSVNDKVAGYFVLSELPKQGSIWIVDIVSTAIDEELVVSCIQTARELRKLKEGSSVWCFATHGLVANILKRSGFWITPLTPRFTIRCSQSLAGFQAKSGNWNFFHGDGDNELYDH